MMKQKTAPACLTVRIITGLTLLGACLFLVAAFTAHIIMLIPFAIIAVTCLICYAFAPVAYEVEGSTLTIRYNLGSKVFTGVTGCRLQEKKPRMSIRLFGNGGLFAGTGIFWSRDFGVFRAYITSNKKEDLVVVSARGKTIVISPEAPSRFVEEYASLQN